MPLNPESDKIDPAELRSKEDVARDLVVRCALSLASHQFAEPAEDPGWEAEYQEDMLRDAVVLYAQAIKARRSANA